MNRTLRKTGCSGEHGFTMIEVLGAIVILAITIVPLLGLFAMAPALHLQREELTRAAFLAQVRTEEVRDNLIGSFGGDFNKPNGAAGDFHVDDGFEPSDSRYKYTISHNDDDELKDVTVTVWHDDDGDNGAGPEPGEQSVTLRTKVSRRL